MAVGQQTDQQGVDQMALTDDHLTHLRAERVDEDRFALDPLIEFLDIDYFAHKLYVFFVCFFRCRAGLRRREPLC